MMKYCGIFLILLACACQSQEPPTLEERIEAMEEQTRKDTLMNMALADSLTSAYLQYADERPEDSLSVIYLSRAADIFKEMPRKGLKAINVYNRIEHEYPEHPMAGRSVFMIGFVYDERYQDKERARKAYEYFIETYPEHELVPEARNLLILLQDSLSEEEMVARWLQEQQNKKN